MKSNVETIKFTTACGLVFFILTYIVTLNMEIGFFQPNWNWMSNNFALTICGGAFASFFVLILCEVQKYINNKTTYENFLFYQAMYLYVELFLLDKNIQEYISNNEEPISENMMENRIQRARSCVSAIQGVEYVTIRKQDILSVVFQNFCTVQLPKVNSLFETSNYIKISIIKTKIINTENGQTHKAVTSSDALVEKTLTGIHKALYPLLNDISKHLQLVDKHCNKRFDWDKQKDIIHKSYISIFKAGRFEDFLKNFEETSCSTPAPQIPQSENSI